MGAFKCSRVNAQREMVANVHDNDHEQTDNVDIGACEDCDEELPKEIRCLPETGPVAKSSDSAVGTGVESSPVICSSSDHRTQSESTRGYGLSSQVEVSSVMNEMMETVDGSSATSIEPVPKETDTVANMDMGTESKS